MDVVDQSSIFALVVGANDGLATLTFLGTNCHVLLAHKSQGQQRTVKRHSSHWSKDLSLDHIATEGLAYTQAM